MTLLRKYLASELGKMMQHGIRLLAIGNLRSLPPAVREALRASIAATRNNTGMTVILAVSYGGREEIAQADARDRPARRARRADRRSRSPRRPSRSISATQGVPDPDLLIRTSGEMRISNFFLWQLAYTEIVRHRHAVAGLPRARVSSRRWRSSSSGSGASVAPAAQVERERLRAV